MIQQKPFVKALRLETELTFNLPLNENFIRHVGAGGGFTSLTNGLLAATTSSTGDGRLIWPPRLANLSKLFRKSADGFLRCGHISYVPVTENSCGLVLWAL